MILNCITAIIIVAIICTAIVVNSYISKKTADYKASLSKRKVFMKDIGYHINRINEDFKHIDKERAARERISTDLRFIMDYIYKYCDNID